MHVTSQRASDGRALLWRITIHGMGGGGREERRGGREGGREGGFVHLTYSYTSIDTSLVGMAMLHLQYTILHT